MPKVSWKVELIISAVFGGYEDALLRLLVQVLDAQDERG